MEEDIQNNSTTVMFRGTPCSFTFCMLTSVIFITAEKNI